MIYNDVYHINRYTLQNVNRFDWILLLTHWDLNQMSDLLLTTFSNSFPSTVCWQLSAVAFKIPLKYIHGVAIDGKSILAEVMAGAVKKRAFTPSDIDAMTSLDHNEFT